MSLTWRKVKGDLKAWNKSEIIQTHRKTSIKNEIKSSPTLKTYPSLHDTFYRRVKDWSYRMCRLSLLNFKWCKYSVLQEPNGQRAR